MTAAMGRDFHMNFCVLFAGILLLASTVRGEGVFRTADILRHLQGSPADLAGLRRLSGMMVIVQ